ncbi:MAG TPA: hypothetical protein VEH53_03455 [archaeon]|nr:hypothetical protein [archaeon]
MRLRMLGLMLLLIPVLVTLSWPADHGQIRELIQEKKIVLGQAPRDVRAVIGEPTKITKVVTYWESSEDWVYGEGKDAFRFTFQDGRLVRVAQGDRFVIY